jgi:hypothetical protein
MAISLNEVIRKLEQQRASIEKALAALHEIEGGAPADSGPAPNAAPAAGQRGRRKGGMTPEGRRRLSEALKARWAAKRSGGSEPAAAPARTAAKNDGGGISAEGRKRLSEALKKRWAAKRAASAVKKRK